MCSALCLDAREKKAKAYHDGFTRMQGVLDSFIALRELLEKAGDDAYLSADGLAGLAHLLDILNRAGWDALEKMPFAYEFRKLIGLPPGKE